MQFHVAEALSVLNQLAPETQSTPETLRSAPDRPALSICVATRNRGPFLRRLLARLAEDTAEFRGQVEVVVCDDASTDDTPEICRAAPLGDALRCHRNETALGAAPAQWKALSASRGRFGVLLGDDDLLLWPGVFRALNLLENNPGAVAVFAPETLIDLSAPDSARTLVYAVEEVRRFGPADRADFAEYVLANGVVSGAPIVRLDHFRRIAPFGDGLIHDAYAAPAELLSFGEIIYADQSFYGLVTQHDGLDHVRHADHDAAKVDWDRHRAGVEHIMGMLGAQPAQRVERLRAMGERIVQSRMLVALRLRLADDDDPVEAYHLASRLRGLGRMDDLPVPMTVIRLRAGIRWLDDRIATRVGATRLVLVGYGEDARAFFAERSRLPVAAMADDERLGPCDIALLAGNGEVDVEPAAVASAGFFITESDLLAKHP